MPSLRLTDAFVRTVASSEAQEDYRDTAPAGHGLFLRVFASGTKTWFVEYRTKEGKRRRYRLGEYPEVTLKAARKLALKARAQAADGTDPQEERIQERRALRSPPETVGLLFERFFETAPERDRATRRPRSAALDRWYFERYIRPSWGDRPAKSITRGDVRDLVKGVETGSGSLSGRKTRSAPRALKTLLSRVFQWGVDDERLPASPVVRIRLAKPESRSRVLASDEIAILWRELAALAEVAPLSAGAFRILLLTGQRPGEVLRLRWRDLLTSDLWEIPASVAKSGAAHRVPLVPWALAELDRLRRLTGGAVYVFDSPRKPGAPISSLKTACAGLRIRLAGARLKAEGVEPEQLAAREGLPLEQVREAIRRAARVQGRRDLGKTIGTTVGKAVGARRARPELLPLVERLAQVERWTPHDVRRTVATQLAEGGTPRFTIERVLGHADASITGTYDRHGYDAEKRAALLAWQGRLEGIIRGPGEVAEVVDINRGRA